MYSDESNSKESSEKTLKEFLYSLYPDENDEKTQAYGFPFQFFQDILVKSVFSSSLEVFFRMVFFIGLDFFIVFSSPVVPWFESFFPDKDKLTYSYISSKVSLQVVSSLVILLIFNMIIIQWSLFIIYDPIKHLSAKSATFLHIAFNYLPPILSLLLGFLFGCLLILNSEGEMTSNNCTFLSLMVSIIFILLAISYYAYCIFTRYSMLIRRGAFSAWEPPYSIISLLIFFLIATAFPFVTSSFRKTCTIFGIVTLVWSLSTIYSRQKPVYISFVAYFAEIKVAFDGVLFSVLLIVNIWVNINFHLTTILMQILFLLSLFFAGIMSSSPYSFLRSSILVDGDFNQANFTNSNSCIMVIRTSIYYSVTNIVQKVDFLKWMLRNRFSTELIPEIVRLNYVLNKNLDEFQIPISAFSPLELISLKFLAFQVRQYEKFILSSPNDPSITYAIEEAQRLMQIVDNVSKVFWTNKDYEQLSIVDYGKKVYRITSFIRNLAISYPHSSEIQNLWVKYSKSVIQEPSEAVIKHVHEFTYIENPGNTVYHFLNQALPENFDTRNQKRIDSTTEHFISTFVEEAYNPIVRFYSIVPILILLVGIAFAVLFAFRANKAFDLFADNMKILSLSISLCLDSLNNADSLVQLPSNSFISKSLHISMDAASMFRNDIQILDSTYDKLSSFMGLFDQYEIDINISSCPRFTLGFMIIFQFPENTINIHKCHLFWAAAYSRRLTEIAAQNIEDFYPFFSNPHDENKVIGPDQLQGIIICIFNLIFIIAFIVITLKQRKRIKKLILSIENIVAMNNEICQRGEPYIGFSAFIYTILIILLVAILSLYYIIYIFPIRSTEDKMKNLANQTLIVSNVCRFSTLAMASSIIEVGLKQALLSNSDQSYIESIDDFNNSYKFPTVNDDDYLAKLTKYINEIATVRKFFTRNLIIAANQLTLCDMDEILRSATKWLVDPSQVSSIEKSFISDLIATKSDIKINKSLKSTKFKNKKYHIYSIVSNSQEIFKNLYHSKPKKFVKNDINIMSNFTNNTMKKKISNSNLFQSNSNNHFEFSSEIDFEAATMTPLSAIVIDFAQLLDEDNLSVDSFNFLMARLMYKINISTLLTTTFPEIATLDPVIFSYIDEKFWVYFVLTTFLLLIVSHFIYFQIKCQRNWFNGISVLIRRAMAKYPERLLYIIGVILEDKPKYFDVLPVPIIVLNNKGTILYANQVVMQYTKHTMDQTIGQPCNEFFTENSTKYTDLTFSKEKRSFANLNEKERKKKEKHSDRKNKSENESDDIEDIIGNNNDDNIENVDLEDCFDFVILRDTSKCMELQKTFNDLKERVTPEVGAVPSRGRLIFIECRFQTESVKPDVVFSKIEAVSSKYKTIEIKKKIESIKKHFFSQNSKKSDDETMEKSSDNDNDNNNSYDKDNEEESDNIVDNVDDMNFDTLDLFDFKDDDDQLNHRCVTVISCGASYLTAIARIGCEEEAIRFVLDLSSDIFMNFRASITEGFGTVLSILEGGSIVVVAGDVARRATDANLSGLWGRIYIDYSIIERSGIEKELQNDEFDKFLKNEKEEENGAKNLNANKNLNLGNLNSGLNKAPQGNQLPKLPGMSPFGPGSLGQKPSNVGQPPPQGGMFGLAKFGLGFGLNKPAASQATLNLKKSLIISISPMSKI